MRKGRSGGRKSLFALNSKQRIIQKRKRRREYLIFFEIWSSLRYLIGNNSKRYHTLIRKTKQFQCYPRNSKSFETMIFVKSMLLCRQILWAQSKHIAFRAVQREAITLVSRFHMPFSNRSRNLTQFSLFQLAISVSQKNKKTKEMQNLAKSLTSNSS